jgi:hypothetical protein
LRPLIALVLVSSSAAVAEADAGVAPPAVAPAVVSPAAPSVLDSVLQAFRPYATIKPTVIASSAAVESFSQPNASAITAAGNPVLATAPADPRLTFQVAQSRAGVWLNEKGVVRGQVELDFIDFTKASPTVASLPRLRIAKVEWAPTDAFTLMVGQDWDLHAPVNAHGSNMVGARFQSGNLAFMRQQIKAVGRLGDFELGGAIGMEGANVTSKDAAFELSGVPTFALRGAWLVGKGKVGLSGIVTSLRLNLGAPTERRAMAGGVTAFADVTFGRTTVRGELSAGQNMANLGLLSLGQGGPKDVGEWGGFVSVRQGITDMHFVYGTAGLMRVFNRDAVRPSYSYPTVPADGTPPAFSTAGLAGTGPGIVHNAGVTLGYELRINKNLAFLLEGFFLQTEHQLLATDVDRADPTRRALGGELATFVTF